MNFKSIVYNLYFVFYCGYLLHTIVFVLVIDLLEGLSIKGFNERIQ